jgi:hypothetical protein
VSTWKSILGMSTIVLSSGTLAAACTAPPSDPAGADGAAPRADAVEGAGVATGSDASGEARGGEAAAAIGYYECRNRCRSEFDVCRQHGPDMVHCHVAYLVCETRCTSLPR